jgi:hypothetical protein
LREKEGRNRGYVQNLLALGQVRSKGEACNGGVVRVLLQRIDGIVDFVEISYALGRLKSMNGRIEQISKTKELRLDLRKERKRRVDEIQKKWAHSAR